MQAPDFIPPELAEAATDTTKLVAGVSLALAVYAAVKAGQPITQILQQTTGGSVTPIGPQWFAGPGAPGGAIGKVGDFAFDTTNLTPIAGGIAPTLYYKTAIATWTPFYAAPFVSAGTAAPSGGEPGDTYDQVDAAGLIVAHWYNKTSGGWTKMSTSPGAVVSTPVLMESGIVPMTGTGGILYFAGGISSGNATDCLGVPVGNGDVANSVTFIGYGVSLQVPIPAGCVINVTLESSTNLGSTWSVIPGTGVAMGTGLRGLIQSFGTAVSFAQNNIFRAVLSVTGGTLTATAVNTWLYQRS